MSQNVLGVIGGSGFYQMKGLDKVELMELETPFGRPSDPFYQGRIGDIEVVFLAAPRHFSAAGWWFTFRSPIPCAQISPATWDPRREAAAR
jgi:hypothetical protein